MSKTRIAIVGYGNIGKYAAEAINAAEDLELAGVVRRSIAGVTPPELAGAEITDDMSALRAVDVALLCTPTRAVEQTAKKYLEMGISTVDSYDIHGSIYDLKQSLVAAAKQYNAVSIVSAGWDPGSDSIIRALLQACAPKGITYTNFGPGMSMGHAVAAKSVAGVKDALSVTIPLGTGIHRRLVYTELADGADFGQVEASIKADPYFSHDETHVFRVENVDSLIDRGSGVNMVRKGVSGETQNQLFEFNMKINNPALTSQVMVACARAAMRQKSGAYTLIEIPVIDLLPGDRETLIRKLV